MIGIQTLGGAGNHMLVYFLGCILAYKNKSKIYIISNAIDNDSISQRYDTRMAIYKIAKSEHLSSSPPDSYTYTITSIRDFYTYLEGGIEPDKNYLINIMPDSINFYLPYLDILTHYMNPDIFTSKEDSNTSIFISLRLGMGSAEVAQPSPFSLNHNSGGLRLPFIYYSDVINRCLSLNPSIDRIVILSDNYEDAYIKNFDIFKGRLSILYKKDYNTYDQFKYIINAKYFISSNSSFSLLGTIFNRGVVFIPNFIDSNSPYPGIENSRYAPVLNVNAPNIIKQLIPSTIM